MPEEEALVLLLFLVLSGRLPGLLWRPRRHREGKGRQAGRQAAGLLLIISVCLSDCDCGGA